MMFGHCCHCGGMGEPINFRVYDFSDGTLLWEDRLPFPMVATDGKVYSKKYALVTESASFQQSTGAMNAVAPHGDTVLTDNLYSMAWEWRDYTDGAVLGASPILDYQIPAGGAPNYDEQGVVLASQFAVNNSGQIGWGNPAPHPGVVIVETNNPTTTATYYLRPTRARLGSIVLRAGTLGTALTGGTTATITANSTAAAAAAAITSGWGSNIVSVTATCAGVNLTEAAIKLVVEWAHADYYLSGIQRPLTGWTPLGGGYLQNLQTGAITTYSSEGVSSSYTATGRWASNNTTLLKSTANTLNALIKIVSAFNVTATPWSSIWNSGVPAGGAVNPNDSQATINHLCADNDRVLISHTAVYSGGPGTPGGVVNNAGTNVLTLTGGVPTSTALGGSWVQGGAIEDGGTDVCVINQQWASYQSYTQHSGDPEYPTNGEDYYAAWRADSIEEVTGSGVAAMTGQSRVVQRVFGFDADRLAVIGFSETDIDDAIIAQNGDLKHIDRREADVAAAPLPPEHNKVEYFIHSPPHLSYADCEWRLEWPDLGVYTAWLADTATLADVNTALVNAFGLDNYGTPNAVASIAGFTINTNTPIMIWQQAMEVEIISAKSYQTPSDWGWVDEFQGMAAWNLVERLAVRVRNVVPHRPDTTVAALNWASGSFDWSRRFHPALASDLVAGPHSSTLKNGYLYVHGGSANTLAEVIEDTGLERSYSFLSGGNYLRFGRDGMGVSYDNSVWAKWLAFPYTEIVEAVLALTATAVTGTSSVYTVYGVAATSHSTPLTMVDINMLPRTTASASVSFSGVTVGAEVVVNVRPILDELLAISGWTPGTTDMGLVWIRSASADNNYVDADAELRIKGFRV